MRMVLVVLAPVVCLAQDTSPERLIEAGHWKRARVLVEARLHVAPPDANATFLLSQIRAAFGEREAPVALAEKAVRLDGGVARYHRQLAEVQGLLAQHANVFQQIGIARRFRKEIDAAIALDGRDPQALRDLLEFYLVAPGIAGGDVKKAAAMADRIAAIDACEGFLAKARVAEYRKDTKEQQAMLRRAVEARPGSYKAQITLAELCLTPSSRDEGVAEAAVRKAIAIDDGRADGYGVLAAIYAGRANWTALEELLSTASAAVPDDLTPYYRAADRLLTDGRDFARAERYLGTYLSQTPEGNRPTNADAQHKLDLARNGRPRKGVSQ
jgi:tetratricopeptide (TPR) repeat protein